MSGEAAGSVHVELPAIFGGDGDKAVCRVRVSEKPGRRFAATPSDLAVEQEGVTVCERCYLRTLRSWQARDPDISPVVTDWPGWPWGP